MQNVKPDCFVTLERCKDDMACHIAKNDFITRKVENYLLTKGFALGTYHKQFVESILDLLKTPSGMFISERDFQKVGSK